MLHSPPSLFSPWWCWAGGQPPVACQRDNLRYHSTRGSAHRKHTYTYPLVSHSFDLQISLRLPLLCVVITPLGDGARDPTSSLRPPSPLLPRRTWCPALIEGADNHKSEGDCTTWVERTQCPEG